MPLDWIETIEDPADLTFVVEKRRGTGEADPGGPRRIARQPEPQRLGAP
jgi:hypothetical protein